MRAFLIAFLCVAAFAAAPSAAQDTPQSLRDEAFEAAQWAMVSDAADALAQLSARFAQGDGDVAPLADKREDLLARRASLERRMEETYAQSGAEADQRRAALRTEHETVLKDLTSVEGEIERRFPDYAELTSPKALPVKEVQALLAPNEGMILILSNPEAAYVWGVSKTKVTWARAEDLNEKALAETVATLRVGLSRKVPSRAGGFVKPGASASKFDGAAAHLVYDRLIRPVEGAFEGVDTLIAVPTGPLNSLPLAALVTRAPTADAPAKAGDFLIDRYAVAVLPSVSSLKALRCQLAREGTPRSSACPAGSAGRRQAAIGGERLTLAGFGAPTIGSAASAGGTERSAGDMTVRGLADPEALRKLSYLPGSLAELEALKARSPKSLIKVGDAATETAVRATYRDQLARADNVIFSTHGLVAGTAFTADGNGAVAEPGLVLTPPKSASAADDGFLSASEAAQLRLSADFVVLSACNTAAPDGRPGAEGLSGLARAFFYAGARSVLVSHWEVSDAATSALMVSAFDAARDRSVGGRAKAMRKAMLEVRADPKHADPYFWAPFALVGEPAV